MILDLAHDMNAVRNSVYTVSYSVLGIPKTMHPSTTGVNQPLAISASTKSDRRGNEEKSAYFFHIPFV